METAKEKKQKGLLSFFIDYLTELVVDQTYRIIPKSYKKAVTRKLDRIRAINSIDGLVKEYARFYASFSTAVVLISTEFIIIILLIIYLDVQLEYKKAIGTFAGNLFFYIILPFRGIYDLYQKADTNGKLAFIGTLLGSTVLSSIVVGLYNHFRPKKK